MLTGSMVLYILGCSAIEVVGLKLYHNAKERKRKKEIEMLIEKILEQFSDESKG